MAFGIHGQDPQADVDVVSLPNEGQQTMANSISVAIASDQSAVSMSINQTGTANDVDANVRDGSGNSISSATTIPVGTERGIITRSASPPPVSALSTAAWTSAPQTLEIDTTGYSVLAFTVNGGVGVTFSVETTIDGTNWYSVYFNERNDLDYNLSDTSRDAVFQAPVAGATKARIALSAITSGTVNVNARAATSFTTGPMVVTTNVTRWGGTVVDMPTPSNDILGVSNSIRTLGYNHLYDVPADVWTRERDAANALNSTGTGIATAQIIGQFDDTAPTSITENQFGNVRISTNRNLYGTIRDAAGNERGANVNASGQLSTSVDNTVTVAGAAAHDAGVSGNPVPIAGISQDMDDTAPPNQVSAEGEVVRLSADRDGALFVRPFGPRIWSYHEDSSSALTDAEVHAAPAAGLSLYVTDVIISLGAATALNVFFEEGSTKKLGPYYLEAVNGRSLHLRFTTPKKITAATALTVTTSAALAHAIDVLGFIAQG